MPLIGLLAASWTLGGIAVRAQADDIAALRWARRMLAGLCFCAMLAVSIGASSLTAAQITLYVIGFCGLAFEAYRGSRASAVAASPFPAIKPDDLISRLCCFVVAGALLLALISAFAPVTVQDPYASPLTLAKHYAREGHIAPANALAATGQPQYGAALYAVAFRGTSEKPAQVLNVFFAALLCAMLFAVAHRHGGLRAGWMAAAIGATAPIFTTLASQPSAALLHAALILAALDALARWHAAPSRRALLLVAFFMGTACGVEYTAWIAVGIVLLALPVLAPRRRIRTALLFFFAVILFALPEMVYAARNLGDPVFPILGTYLPMIPHLAAPAVDALVSLFFEKFPPGLLTFIPGYLPKSVLEIPPIGIGLHPSVTETGGNALVPLLRFPWDIVMRPGQYDGWAFSAGPLVLAFGIAALILGNTHARLLAIFGVLGALTLFFCLRSGHAMLPFFAVVWGAGALTVVHWKQGARLVQAALVLSFMAGLLWSATQTLPKWRVILGLETRVEYLRAQVPRYAAIEALNRLPGAQGTALLPDDSAYFLDLPAHSNNHPLQALLRQPSLWRLFWLSDNGIRYVVYPVEHLHAIPALQPLVPLFEAWRADKENLRLIERVESPGVDGKMESTEIYEVVFEG